jgi:hypothetical protein
MLLHIYQTPQGKNRKICAAFAAGSGAPIVPPYPLLPGDAFMFGVLRGVLATLRQAQREGRNWFYADNGYFFPGRRISERGYYRITKNAMQHDGSGDSTPDRWSRLGIKIKPWRKTGSHIVICPPGRLLAAAMNVDADQWLTDMLANLRASTDRPFRLRKKMSWEEVMRRDGPTLADDLRECWALVTHSSNAAVEALIAGVPVLCTDRCAAYRMGSADVSQIEKPLMREDREQWAWNLAANQWNIDEMRDGTCWRELSKEM